MINVTKDITVHARKFDGSLHRSWNARLTKNDSNIVILDGVFEFEVNHPSLGLIEKGTRSIEFYWHDRWYNVFTFYQPKGELRNFYCNINLPPKFDSDILSFIDLDLDILVTPDFNITLLDEEEFKINSTKYNYPLYVLQNADKAKNDLLGLIERREFPFNI